MNDNDENRQKIVANSAVGKQLPAVSVIVPCYNDEKYIPDCLDSLLSQTFANWEAICVNDGSADESLSILEKYAKCDPRIKVINQKNQGVCFARNNAIKIARGKYIFPLDADDKIAATALSELYKTITTTDYALVYTDGIFFQEECGKWDMLKPTKWNMYTGHNVVHNSAMYDKKYWKQFGGYNTELNRFGHEDFDFFLNFLDAGLKIYRISKPLFYYRIKTEYESRNALVKGERKLQIQRMIERNHPQIRRYKRLARLKKIALMLPRFIFVIKTKKDRKTKIRMKYIRIFRIPVYCWKNKNISGQDVDGLNIHLGESI